VLTNENTLPREANAKADILRAALEVFARDGFDGASLPKIAEAARVGHPLIHYYFGSKENLWRETVSNSIGGIVAEAAAIDIALRGLSPVDKLCALIRTFTLFAARYPSHLAILMFEIRGKTERLSWLMEHYTEPFRARWRDVLLEAQDKGLIKQIPVDHLTSIITGSITHYFSINAYRVPDRPLEDLATEHADCVIGALLSGITVRPPAGG
jgi:AcrR family transcriptional regulator